MNMIDGTTASAEYLSRLHSLLDGCTPESDPFRETKPEPVSDFRPSPYRCAMFRRSDPAIGGYETLICTGDVIVRQDPATGDAISQPLTVQLVRDRSVTGWGSDWDYIDIDGAMHTAGAVLDMIADRVYRYVSRD